MNDKYDIVLECRNVRHWFGHNRVLYDVNLEIARGEIVALVGPSGCGKSTLLRAILGTHPPKGGQVLMNGQPYARPSRERGIVYQRYALFPFLTAEGNVAFGPMLDETSLAYRCFRFWQWRQLRKRHLHESRGLLERVGLGNAIASYPAAMSGGMQQRVAIAQALIMKPEILLLDEPFGALDEATREELQEMLLRLYQENLQARQLGQPPPHTVLIVTHELNEAIYVSDRVLGLSQYWKWEDEPEAGEQPGATIVYDRPAPVFQPDDAKDINHFILQREEIRRAVFSPTERPTARSTCAFGKSATPAKASA